LNWRNLTAPEHRDRDGRALAELRECRVCKPFEKDNVRRADGRRVPVLMGCAMLEGPWDDDCVGFLVDLTERRTAEEAVREHQRRLHALASELLRAEERERRRVAVVLHDSVSATLALAKRNVAALGRPAMDEAARAGRIAEIEQMIAQAIEHTRSLTSELSPPVLYELGLVLALRWLCDRFGAEHGLDCDVEDDGRPKPVGDELRLVLFQAARELLVNAVKHARAARCQITVRRVAPATAGRGAAGANGRTGGGGGGSDAIELTVADDGLGFAAGARAAAAASDVDERPAARSDGFGLFNIRERLAHLGGRLDISSEPDAGAIVTVTAPLAAAFPAAAQDIHPTTVVDGVTV
jgi:signal transduction histidine kinase